MFVFIDESGCSGFKFNRGSTKYFLISCVIFKDKQQVQNVDTATATADLRNSLGGFRKFHFTDCPNRIRDAYFRTLVQYDFDVRVLVVDKLLIHSDFLKHNKANFYSFFVQMLMKYDHGVLSEAKIRIDKSSDRTFQRELKTYLQRQFRGQNKIKDIKFLDSKGNNLIQLADMCVGAIARSYNRADKKDGMRWRSMIQPRIQNIWNFQ